MRYNFSNPELARIAALADRSGAQMSYTGDTPNGVGMDVNLLPARNLYPGAGGGTLGTLASASSPDAYNAAPGGGPDGLTGPGVDTPPSAAHGLSWWLGIAILIGLILWAARKTGNANEFSNLRASAYNISLITLVAVVGLTALKIVAVQLKNFPLFTGFAQVVLAA